MLQAILLQLAQQGGEVERRPSLACIRVRTDRLAVVEEDGNGGQGDGDNTGLKGSVEWRVMLGGLGLAAVKGLGL